MDLNQQGYITTEQLMYALSELVLCNYTEYDIELFLTKFNKESKGLLRYY
jgi:Ca2+-binding EF-hand superfamily protein